MDFNKYHSLLSNQKQYEYINNLLSFLKSLSNNDQALNHSKYKITLFWEEILDTFPKHNIYYKNLHYSQNWSDNYIEHFQVLAKNWNLEYEVNFNINNIHALIFNSDIPFTKKKFKSFKTTILSINPTQNFCHPYRHGIAIPYLLNSHCKWLLIDGNHRAYKATNSWFYDFVVYKIPLFGLTPPCFDSYLDLMTYYLLLSIQFLLQSYDSEELLNFLKALDIFFQESQSSIYNGSLNPYIANQ